MKLGLLRYQYHHTGGAERTLGLLARGLLQRGHEVHIVCAKWSGEEVPGVYLHRVEGGYGKEFAGAAVGALNRLGLDTFLSLERAPQSPLVRAGDGCHAAWLARRERYENPLKRLSFRLNPKHRATLDLEREMFTWPALQKVVANSRLVAAELQEYFGLGPDKVELVYNGVDRAALAPALDQKVRASAREELGLRKGEPGVLFLGSGFERKGLAFALKALAKLKQGRLVVAGSDRTAHYKALAARLGVGGRVSFLGPRRDPERLLAAADCLLLPTIYDPCANSCLEALCAGVPVVTTRANGAGELVKSGQSGMVVEEPSDAGALALAVEKALEMKGPFEHRVPGLEEWLGRMADILERTAGSLKRD